MYAGACGADVPGNPNIAPEPNLSLNDGDLLRNLPSKKAALLPIFHEERVLSGEFG